MQKLALLSRKKAVRRRFILFANVPDEVSLLASGTKACSAGDVPEVPQAQGLTPSVCSALLIV
jgi:hypothetical protein